MPAFQRIIKFDDVLFLMICSRLCRIQQRLQFCGTRLPGEDGLFSKTTPTVSTAISSNVRNSMDEVQSCSKKYPSVGVGVVILRRSPSRPGSKEALLIRRGKPPSKGMWSFCGGSQEFGESIVECAIREAREETGLQLRCDFPESRAEQPEPKSHSPSGTARPKQTNHSPKAFISSDTLEYPVPFTAVDVIDGPSLDNITYHYSIVEVAATPLDPLATAKAADDADEAAWFSCDDLDALRARRDIVCNAVDVIELALQRFKSALV